MRTRELLLRRKKLRLEYEKLKEEMSRATENLQAENVNRFISSGEVESEPRVELDSFRQKLEYLESLSKGLVRELARAAKGERRRAIDKARGELTSIRRQREALAKKYTRILKKTIDPMKKKDKELADRELVVKQEVRGLKTSKVQDSFRLNKSEQWLDTHFIREDWQRRNEILKIRKENQAIVKGLSKSDRDEIVRGVSLIYDPLTGELEKFEFYGNSWSMIKNSPNKELFLKEALEQEKKGDVENV